MKTKICLTVLAVMVHMVPSAQAQDARTASTVGGELQLARYSSAPLQPEAGAGNPLGVVAIVHFPRSDIKTVGDAVRHLLLRTGYALSPDEQLDAQARNLLELPLPESHRRLGPYRVEDMLSVLLGSPWVISFDRVARRVAFQTISAANATR